MTGTTIDHLVAVTVFLGAILLFISLFNQTIQTAIVYQRHRYLATKCSDLLDDILLNPGYPTDWGQTSASPTSFGLQDLEFPEYRLSPFSLMRLNYSLGTPVFYPKTGLYYSNLTVDFGKSLMVSYNEIVNYSAVSELLGINGTYGFSFSASPIVTVSISETQKNPLGLLVKVAGAGSPLANANLSYCMITVHSAGAYPSYNIEYGKNTTDDHGERWLTFPSIDSNNDTYVIIAYAQLSGLIGVGYQEHVSYDQSYIVPLVSNLNPNKILLAHSWDLGGGSSSAEVTYNVTFVLLTEEFSLREMPLENSTGKLNSGVGNPYQELTLPTNNSGILAVTYQKSAIESGIVLMPWGVNALAFPMVFGGNPTGKEWVTTDIRQVIVDRIAYQATLALWSLEGYQVVG